MHMQEHGFGVVFKDYCDACRYATRKDLLDACSLSETSALSAMSAAELAKHLTENSGGEYAVFINPDDMMDFIIKDVTGADREHVWESFDIDWVSECCEVLGRRFLLISTIDDILSRQDERESADILFGLKQELLLRVRLAFETEEFDGTSRVPVEVTAEIVLHKPGFADDGDIQWDGFGCDWNWVRYPLDAPKDVYDPRGLAHYAMLNRVNGWEPVDDLLHEFVGKLWDCYWRDRSKDGEDKEAKEARACETPDKAPDEPDEDVIPVVLSAREWDAVQCAVKSLILDSFAEKVPAKIKKELLDRMLRAYKKIGQVVENR